MHVISKKTQKISMPRDDDRNITNIVFGLASAQALFVAHELKLFELLAQKAMSLNEVCVALKIKPRPTQALLSMCASQGLLLLKGDGRYALTEMAEDYLLPDSPTYYGAVLDQGLQASEVFSFTSLKKAILTNKPQVYGGEDLFHSHEKAIELAKTFTRAMHSKSMAAATVWPKTIDLSNYKCMLDIAGGSGAHAIGATITWPSLQVIIFERPFVCDVANEYIEKHQLHGRIKTYEGDMWQDPFPETDLHFYCDVFHDWPYEKCQFLAQKSFESLLPGGRIIIHEMLFNDNKTGPYSVAAYNINMLLWTEGQQYSGKELSGILTDVGFVDLQIFPSGFGNWYIITAKKQKN